MFFREKTKLAALRDAWGPSFFSVLKDAWRTASSGNSNHSYESHASLGRDFGKRECPPELQPLIGVSSAVRQRILANAFLGGWTSWWTWILSGLIVVAALSARWTWALILAAALAVVGAGVILFWVWWTRLSIYDAGCRLDSAAGLYDRISTAIFLGDIRDADEMLQCQRRDTIRRLGKVDSRRLFPVRMPSTPARALALVLAASACPSIACTINRLRLLLQTTARSQFVQSVLSPIVQAMEQDFQKTVAIVTAKVEASADEVRAGEASPSLAMIFGKTAMTRVKARKTREQDHQQAGAGDQSESKCNK